MEVLETYDDALALCFAIFGETLLHFGAWYDALVLDVILEDFVLGTLHLEEYSTHDSWMIATHGGFVDDLELWLMEAWLGLDDVLVGGGGTLMIWRQFLFYILPVSWSMPPLRVGFLKPLLAGSKRLQAGSCKRSWYSYFSWH